MSIHGPPDCYRCERPITAGSGVLLGNKLFHPGCAVVTAKENKHGSNTHDARRSEQGEARGLVSHTDAAGN